MIKCEFLDKYERIHFIGVGGISMSGLAKYCVAIGKKVSGSDVAENELTAELVKAGVRIYTGHRSENLTDAQLVVYTSAVKENNPELVEAVRLKLPLKKRSEILGEIMRSFGNSVAVSGCHGKTTTTAMITRILECAGKDPVAFLGGTDFETGNFRMGDGDFGICEACEYRRNFLDITPTVAVVLNIDDDHLDSYGDIDNVKKAFSDFSRGRLTVVNADDPGCADIPFKTAITFGIENEATYKAINLIKNENGYSFTAIGRGNILGRANLKVAGLHNVYNALAAISVGDSFFIDFKSIKSALDNFRGVARRMERIGKINGIESFADYAHHPREIAATMKDFGKNKKFAVIFQPHTFSRTRTLMNEFVDCLKDFSTLVIFKTYSAREDYDMKGSAYALYCNLVNTGFEKSNLSEKDSVYEQEKSEREQDKNVGSKTLQNNCVKKIKEGEIKDKTIYYAQTTENLKNIILSFDKSVESLIFVGAGDIYETAKSFITDV